jgi:hypothetical protein
MRKLSFFKLKLLPIAIISSFTNATMNTAVNANVIPLVKANETQQEATLLSCTVTKWSSLKLKQINSKETGNPETTSYAVDFIQFVKDSPWTHESTKRILELAAGKETLINKSKIQLSQTFPQSRVTGKVSLLATKLTQPHQSGLNHGVNSGNYLVKISGSGSILNLVKDNLKSVFPADFHPAAKNPLSFYCQGQN